MVKFKSGELIEECLALMYALDPSEAGRRCDYCFASCLMLWKCPECKATNYCSASCQRQDWEYIHQHGECEMLRATDGQRLKTDTQQLVMRLYLKCKSDPKLMNDRRPLFDGRTRALSDLMSHERSVKQDAIRMVFFEDMADTMQSNGLLKLPSDRDFLFNLFCRVLINSYAIMDPDRRNLMGRVGTVIYVEGSAHDHSCAPNAVQLFDGTKLLIRALRDFDAKQEPVLIHYIDLKLPLDERRSRLRRQYYFECECPRCRTESDGQPTVDYQRLADLEKNSCDITREFVAAESNNLSKQQILHFADAFHQESVVELKQRLDKVTPAAAVATRASPADIAEHSSSSTDKATANVQHGFADKIRQLLTIKS